eukprot:6382669-Alexandrium_andersonii.AAC.1
MEEIECELRRVEAQGEAAEALTAQRAREEFALARNVFLAALGRHGEAQDSVLELERRLEAAAGLLTDNAELREQAEVKDAQCADTLPDG